MRLNRPYPRAIAEAPELIDGLEFYYWAFRDLATCRNSEGDVPWTVIEEYADKSELDEEQRELLHVFTKALCQTVNEHYERRRGNGNPGGVRPTNEGPGQEHPLGSNQTKA